VFDPVCARAKLTALECLDDPLEDEGGENLCRGVPAPERRFVIKIPVVDGCKDRVEDGTRATNVHDNAVGVELRASKFDVHDVSGAVQPLGGPKDLPLETVGDHHVVTN